MLLKYIFTFLKDMSDRERPHTHTHIFQQGPKYLCHPLLLPISKELDKKQSQLKLKLAHQKDARIERG